MGTLLIAALALAGTLLQMWDSVTSYRGSDEAKTFTVIDELRSEVPRRAPRRRRAHGRMLQQLAAESPREWAVYRRLRRVLMAWTFLAVAAGSAVAAALIDLLS